MSKFLKALITFVLVVALLVGTVPAFAAESPTARVISRAVVRSATYTGKKLTPKITVYDTEGRRVSSKYYSVKLSGRFTAGKHKVIITAKAPYTGRITTAFKIYKASNPFKISVGKKSFNRNMKVAQSTRIKVSGVKEQAKYIIKSNKSGVTIAHNRITIKKGWYGTAIITVKTAATKNYKSTTKTIVIKVKK